MLFEIRCLSIPMDFGISDLLKQKLCQRACSRRTTVSLGTSAAVSAPSLTLTPPEEGSLEAAASHFSAANLPIEKARFSDSFR
jgi:hypothetical protein